MKKTTIRRGNFVFTLPGLLVFCSILIAFRSSVKTSFWTNFGLLLLNKELAVHDEVNPERVQSAFDRLDRASLAPHDSRVYFLGLGSELLENTEKSIDYYLLYTRHHPEDLRGRLRLLNIYQTQCQDPTVRSANASTACSTLLAQVCNLSNNVVGNEARRAVNERRFADAWAWYLCIDESDQPFPASDHFLRTIAGMMVGNSTLPATVKDKATLSLFDLPDTSAPLRIDGGALQWLESDPYWGYDYGMTLATFSPEPGKGGVMWWDGVAVVALRESAAQERRYELRVRTRHSSSMPGELKITHNFQEIEAYSLDEQWRELSMSLTLRPGYNILGVEYVEDSGDALIEWIELVPLEVAPAIR